MRELREGCYVFDLFGVFGVSGDKIIRSEIWDSLKAGTKTAIVFVGEVLESLQLVS